MPAQAGVLPTWARWALLANLVAEVLIVVTGGLVRLTGSGLGCPTWPQCVPGSYTPVVQQPQGIHKYIEFGNRTLTGVVGLAALAALVAVIVVVRRQRRPREHMGDPLRSVPVPTWRHSDMALADMLDHYEFYAYKQWMRVYMRSKMIKHNKDLLASVGDTGALLEKLHIY